METVSFFDRLFGRSGQKSEARVSDDNALYYFVRCDKCAEVIRLRLDRRNDFEQLFDENGSDAIVGYRVRKELMGSGNCFKMMQAEITFDRNHRESGKTIRGGTFVTQDEYDDSRKSG